MLLALTLAVALVGIFYDLFFYLVIQFKNIYYEISIQVRANPYNFWR